MSQTLADKAKLYEDYTKQSAFVENGYSSGFVEMLNKRLEDYKMKIVKKNTEPLLCVDKLQELKKILLDNNLT